MRICAQLPPIPVFFLSIRFCTTEKMKKPDAFSPAERKTGRKYHADQKDRAVVHTACQKKNCPTQP